LLTSFIFFSLTTQLYHIRRVIIVWWEKDKGRKEGERGEGNPLLPPVSSRLDLVFKETHIQAEIE